MFVLHVGIVMKNGQAKAAEEVFAGIFRPAIRSQEGFDHVEFLRNNASGEYILSIGFESETLQRKWVATDLHQEVWPLMEQNFLRYDLKTFTSV